MAMIKFSGKKEDASFGGGSKFEAAPRGFYTLQIVEVTKGLRTGPESKNPGVPMTRFTLEIAEGDYIGTRCWKSVPWIPRGSGEKPNPGHGLAVHWLHACHMPCDGEFEFDEQDFLLPEHAMIRALLEVEEYTKRVGDQNFKNTINRVREVYTENHPEPKELPPPQAPRQVKTPNGNRGAVTSKPAGSQEEVDSQLGW